MPSVMNNGFVSARAGLPFFFYKLICFLSFTLFLPPLTLSLFPFTLFVFAVFSCCLCQTSTLHSPSSLASSLKPTPWQPVAASPRKVDSLSVVPQQPNATSDGEACYIINQKQPRGAVKDGIVDMREGERERETGGWWS